MPGSLAQPPAAAAAAAARHWAQAAGIAHHIKPNLLALGVAGAAAPLGTLGLAHPKAAPGTMPEPEMLAGAVAQLAAVMGWVLAAVMGWVLAAMTAAG